MASGKTRSEIADLHKYLIRDAVGPQSRPRQGTHGVQAFDRVQSTGWSATIMPGWAITKRM